MDRLIEAIRSRVLPAVLTAAGVTLVAAGLLSYSGPVEAAPAPTPSGPAATSPAPSADPASPSGLASASPSAVPDRVATRIVVAGLRIDLPVVRGPADRVLCNVAMYDAKDEFAQPGIAGSTYIYAHAREGMFLPLLEASQRNNGRAMIGMLVEVYTSDDQRYLYEITEVRRHVPKTIAYDDPFAATDEILWLQTSEGPKGTPTVLQVVAEPLTWSPADPAAARPVARPQTCA